MLQNRSNFIKKDTIKNYADTHGYTHGKQRRRRKRLTRVGGDNMSSPVKLRKARTHWKGRWARRLVGGEAEVAAAIEKARRREKTRRRQEVKMLEQLAIRSPFLLCWRLWHAAAVSSCMLSLMETTDYLAVANDQDIGAAGIKPSTNSFRAG